MMMVYNNDNNKTYLQFISIKKETIFKHNLYIIIIIIIIILFKISLLKRIRFTIFKNSKKIERKYTLFQ